MERIKIAGHPYQLGSQEIERSIWRLDVFAENKSQRDDFAYHLFYQLEDFIPVYDYDEGFPPSVSPTRIGTLKCYGREMVPMFVFEELVKSLYWRSAINFWTEYEQYNGG